jgi:hypothetical protein
MGDEWILCAAIHLNDGETYPHQPVPTGLVFCGHRHSAIIAQLAAAYGNHASRVADGMKEAQGFLTSRGRFVGRREAYEIAVAFGQVTEGETVRSNILDSSDLY